MQRHTNEWLIGNAKRIEGIKRQLLEHSYAGAYGGTIDLTAVNNLLDGAVLEISQLQKRFEELNEVAIENAKLQKKIEEIEGQKT